MQCQAALGAAVAGPPGYANALQLVVRPPANYLTTNNYDPYYGFACVAATG